MGWKQQPTPIPSTHLYPSRQAAIYGGINEYTVPGILPIELIGILSPEFLGISLGISEIP